MVNSFTVSEFIAHVNDVLSRAWNAEEFCIEGEVSGFRISQGQWVNFDIKDKTGLISVFMTVWQLRVPLEDGLQVRVYGNAKIYAKFGKFSITATKVELVGEGAIKKALLLLEKKLEKEGLFNPDRKRLLSKYPERIALIASNESAAYGDFIRIVKEKWPILKIDSYHVKVQGMGSVESILQAIKLANKNYQKYDALVLTRGGGSLEDLMSFNDERVVRAIFASKITTVVGIGHERDLSLAEKSADIRGSTPTDCARLLIPDQNEILNNLAYLTGDLEQKLINYIELKKEELKHVLTIPSSWLNSKQKNFSNQIEQLKIVQENWLQGLKQRSKSYQRLLKTIDPQKNLKMGYAIVYHDNKIVSSSTKLKINDKIQIVFNKSSKNAKIIK